LRIKKNILFEEQGNDALPFLELGGSRPKAVEGGIPKESAKPYFPPQYFFLDIMGGVN